MTGQPDRFYWESVILFFRQLTGDGRISAVGNSLEQGCHAAGVERFANSAKPLLQSVAKFNPGCLMSSPLVQSPHQGAQDNPHIGCFNPRARQDPAQSLETDSGAGGKVCPQSHRLTLRHDQGNPVPRVLYRNGSQRIAQVARVLKITLNTGKCEVSIDPQDIGFAGEIVEERCPGYSCAPSNVIDTCSLIPLFEEELVGSIVQRSEG